MHPAIRIRAPRVGCDLHGGLISRGALDGRGGQLYGAKGWTLDRFLTVACAGRASDASTWMNVWTGVDQVPESAGNARKRQVCDWLKW